MVGERIALYLKINGLSQRYLARKIGMSENILSTRLTGKSKISAEEYLQICKVLQVPFGTFEIDTFKQIQL